MNSSKNIPGYTGFIPYKSEFFGNTTGASNAQAEMTYRSSSNKFNDVGATILSITGGNQRSRSSAVQADTEQPERKRMFGTQSKNSCSWINGPTHEIRNQCLPGYTGFIPGVKAENVFSHTYAHTTNSSFNGGIVRGANPQGAHRYSTVTGEKFSPCSFRRIVEN